MNILLVSPRTPDTFWSFRHALPFIAKRVAFAPLGLLTVAGMLPRDWKLRVVDLDLRKLEDHEIEAADYVFLSAMIVHRQSVREIAKRCRRLGTPIVAGGPLFTTGHEDFPEIQHFVLGECEDLIDQLVEDLKNGELLTSYEAQHFPKLDRTPIPRWDLIDLKDYASMAVQCSRGCPFNCEFCDIIVMNGRVPRGKAPAQVVAELEALRARNWNGPVFIVDDNFIGNRRRVKEILREIIAWRRRSGARMVFTTEASVNLADDPELLGLMAEAGFVRVFLGIETPEADSLAECHKRQNSGRDLLDSVRAIQNAGIEVLGGFIVGFDADKTDVFQRQFEFIQKAGVVTAMVGLLTALPKTQLHRRLAAEGRLLRESTGNNTEAVINFVTKLDRDFLIDGYRRLMQRLYEPSAFYERARAFLSEYRGRDLGTQHGFADLLAFLRSLWVLGLWHRGRRQYWKFLGHVLLRHRSAFACAVAIAIHGHHFRVVAKQL